MLGKLFKHEWKELSRYLLPIHFIGLIFALCGGILFPVFSGNEPPFEVTLFATLGAFLVFFALSAGTVFLIAAQYYKSLFSDEAYLTHTLPVSKKDLLHVKIIAGSIWTLIDQIICLIGMYAWTIPFMSASAQKEALTYFFHTGIPMGLLILYLVLLALLTCVSSTLLIFACISIGQAFTNHRILGSIVAYIVLYSILQIILVIAMSGAGVLTIATHNTEILTPQISNLRYYLMTTFVISYISSIIEIVVGYLFSRYTLEKQINLN